MFTQQGVRKPLFFNLSVGTGRWARLADKLVHFIGTERELGRIRDTVRIVHPCA